jgi:hypothetical protein
MKDLGFSSDVKVKRVTGRPHIVHPDEEEVKEGKGEGEVTLTIENKSGGLVLVDCEEYNDFYMNIFV